MGRGTYYLVHKKTVIDLENFLIVQIYAFQLQKRTLFSLFWQAIVHFGLDMHQCTGDNISYGLHVLMYTIPNDWEDTRLEWSEGLGMYQGQYLIWLTHTYVHHT